jgi:type II secretory pathway pseudopilin PulG
MKPAENSSRTAVRRRVRRGFTLAEILTAVSIMMLATGIFTACFVPASQAMARAKHMDMATDACAHQIEFYRDVGYASLPAIASGQSTTSVSFTPNSELPAGTGTVTFTRVDDNFAETTASTGRVRVDATVNWAGIGRDRGSYTLSTLIAE